MAKEQPWPFDRGDAGAGQPRTQEGVPGAPGGATSQDIGSEPVSRGPFGDEGGAGSYPGGPTYSEGTTPEDIPNAEPWVPPTEKISGPPMEPTD
ncbi:hypothetical protein [Polyangium sp. 15x6]|uniref:hypothetical protein n=1 Tax=Polyangium sp. 15x6 TaxID=3042687 RepID=UPI00249A9742|nr:hypothetical protein [Polyangium sp. 15x6]MDI3291133.1 hypothetical protein [Polyangium sp. 15x6]